MILQNLLEFARLLLVFVALFVGIPLLVSSSPSAPPEKEQYWSRIVVAFIRVSLFMQVTVLVLGRWKLALAGTVVTSYLGWTAFHIFWSYRTHIRKPGWFGETVYLPILVALERASGRIWYRWLRHRFHPRAILLPGILPLSLTLLTLLQRAEYPINNLRFSKIDTYSRALSLELLTYGQPWEADGSVALLAPLVYFSGLSPVSVIRFSGPILATVLVLSAAFCTFRLTRSPAAAYLGGGLAAVLPVLTEAAATGEITGKEIGSIFWVLSAALVPKSLPTAACAAATAWLIWPGIDSVSVGLLACVLFVLLIGRLGGRLPRWAWGGLLGLATALLATALLTRLNVRPPEGPFQYEAAARSATGIAQQFPRGQWLVISPSHEIPYIYGRGWHLELLDFVSGFGVQEVSKPDFSFPYLAPDIFVFIEKQPLRAGADGYFIGAGLTETMDRAVLAYHAPLGRASLQFQAAAIMSAYAKSHRNLATFYEDEHMVIYQISRLTRKENSPSPASAPPAKYPADRDF